MGIFGGLQGETRYNLYMRFKTARKPQMRARKKYKPPKDVKYLDAETIRSISKEYAARALPPKEVPKQADKEPSGYLEYIQSAKWAMFKLSIVAKRGQQCERCQTRGPVDLHHRTYRNLFNEKPEEVELLCRGCHEQEHFRMVGPRD